MFREQKKNGHGILIDYFLVFERIESRENGLFIRNTHKKSLANEHYSEQTHLFTISKPYFNVKSHLSTIACFGTLI